MPGPDGIPSPRRFRSFRRSGQCPLARRPIRTHPRRARIPRSRRIHRPADLPQARPWRPPRECNSKHGAVGGPQREGAGATRCCLRATQHDLPVTSASENDGWVIGRYDAAMTRAGAMKPVALLLALAGASCGLSLEIPMGPLSGKIGGLPWTVATAQTTPSLSNADELFAGF